MKAFDIYCWETYRRKQTQTEKSNHQLFGKIILVIDNYSLPLNHLKGLSFHVILHYYLNASVTTTSGDMISQMMLSSQR